MDQRFEQHQSNGDKIRAFNCKIWTQMLRGGTGGEFHQVIEHDCVQLGPNEQHNWDSQFCPGIGDGSNSNQGIERAKAVGRNACGSLHPLRPSEEKWVVLPTKGHGLGNQEAGVVFRQLRVTVIPLHCHIHEDEVALQQEDEYV
eukprot:CAMPEP_0174365922 /NCGR_PEP_ID=MMETSP0811_2-20130205/79103_1 /TAXON_ID=73025 ORGANISM="Eutreptiella gymnastica-like, Strain CCMP1594" /NCGR_SAMPLE_ID=MMETSP0811_2 /ASSEMBLY_ACC=CAM_ASM_000667 /LENGTH=143 /DNA_ID=CAMNT_0015506989 /DNA_START=584 /DNA_END=1015 /DNA_ORIENTATION=-